MNFNLKTDHLVPIYLQKLTNATQRPVLSFMYNPGLILWLNIAGHAFFMEENKGEKKRQEKKRPCSMLTPSLLTVPLKTITEANGSLSCINHSNIHN